MGGTVPGGWAEPDDAIARFELTMQRASGAGLAVAVVQATAMVFLGSSLYAPWWLFGAGPVSLACAAGAAWLCLTGRFTGPARPAFALAVSAGAVAATAATATTVTEDGTAMLPIVVISIAGLGFIARPPAAALLGSTIIVCATVGSAVIEPLDVAYFTTEAVIQSLILGSTIAGGHVARRFAVAEERALDELATAVAADRAASAARAERRELEREMHDTVLSTLSAVGRESLPDSPAVRRHCAADARFLRARGRPDEPDGAALRERLDAVAARFAQLGFPVTLEFDEPAVDVPPGVAEALARATREALNNAYLHSGAGCALVAVHPRPGGVTVQVLDRGIGLAPGITQRLGTSRSLIERLDDVGGHANIAAVPAAGTAVTLSWPR